MKSTRVDARASSTRSQEQPLAVFLDIGNVLVETAPLIRQGVETAAAGCRKSGFDVAPDAFVRAYLAEDKKTTRPHVNHLFGDFAIAMGATTQALGEEDIRYAGAFLTKYREYIRGQLRRDPEVVSFFHTLSKCGGMRLGIISDGTTDDQLEIITRLGIMTYLDPQLVLISQDFGEEKVSTRIFEEALRRAGTAPERTFMVGDSIDRDILLPKALGMRTVFFRKYVSAEAKVKGESKADYCCDDLNGALRVLLCGGVDA